MIINIIQVGSRVRTKSARLGTVLSLLPLPDGSTTACVRLDGVPVDDGQPFDVRDVEFMTV